MSKTVSLISVMSKTHAQGTDKYFKCLLVSHLRDRKTSAYVANTFICFEIYSVIWDLFLVACAQRLFVTAACRVTSLCRLFTKKSLQVYWRKPFICASKENVEKESKHFKSMAFFQI